jgi:hypothetical protein
VSQIEIRVVVDYVGVPLTPYRVGLWVPGDDMPLVEQTTSYPEMCAASLLRTVDLTPKRKQYQCPDCKQGNGLHTLEVMQGTCTIEVTEDTFDYPDGETETTFQVTSGVECMCGWSQEMSKEQMSDPTVDPEDWIRSVLEVVEVPYE